MKLSIPTGPYAHVVIALAGGIAIGVSGAIGLQSYAAPAKVQMVAAVPVDGAVRARLVALEGVANSTLEEVRAMRAMLEKKAAPKAKTAAVK
jgi:hypothetical protein